MAYLVFYSQEKRKKFLQMKTKLVKNFLVLLCMSLAFCSQPPNITTIPDDQATTSGTVGSSKATNELPRNPVDTTKRIDTARMRLDSALPAPR
jgi:hypothetical protein